MTLSQVTQTLPRKWPLAEILLLAVAMLWGTSYGVSKTALLYAPVFLFLAIRFSLTFMCLLPAGLYELRGQPLSNLVPALGLGVILLTIFCAETFGILHTSATNAAVLISTCLLITPLIEWLVFKTRPDKRLMLALCLCVVGIGLLVTNGDGQFHLNRGDLFILVAAFLRAVIVVRTKQVLTNQRLSPLSITFLQCGVVAVGSIALMLLSGGAKPSLLALGSTFWYSMMYLVLGCTLFAFFAQNYGIHKTTPTKAALLTGTEPLFGALFAAAWLQESLGLSQWIGCGCIFLATLYVLAKK